MASKYVVALLFLLTLHASLFGCMREYGWGNKSITPNIEIPSSRFNEGSEYFAHSPHSSPYASLHTSPSSSPLSSSPSVVAVTTYKQMKKHDALKAQKESNISFDEKLQELAQIEIE
jgi:hypothetical protein